MVELDRLKVSLTKNGYFKFAELLKAYSRWEILANADGKHEGIDLVPSQIRNMMDENPQTGEIPAFWDDIRAHGHLAIDAFSVVAMLFSHSRLIQLMIQASEGRPEFTGYILRGDLLQEKEYTNLAYTLGCFGLSDYRRGSGAVEYNLTPVVYHLRQAHDLVRLLLRSKLQRSGWIDPALNPLSPDRPLLEEMKDHNFHRVLSMEWDRFSVWLEGTLEMPEFVGKFGLREVKLFSTPIILPPGR